MTEYLEPDDVEPLLNRLGLHVRERGLLLSALAAPLPVFGEEIYSLMTEKAAALMIAVNRDHPMIDGNKRTSWYLTSLFLGLNHRAIRASEDERFEFILAVANGHMGQVEATVWFSAHLMNAPESDGT